MRWLICWRCVGCPLVFADTVVYYEANGSEIDSVTAPANVSDDPQRFGIDTHILRSSDPLPTLLPDSHYVVKNGKIKIEDVPSLVSAKQHKQAVRAAAVDKLKALGLTDEELEALR